ncbi:MAG TPA: hypothetical protein VHR35_15920 [Nocardioides sp.]|nr:hypothetical protein [Nocardioides sp.]
MAERLPDHPEPVGDLTYAGDARRRPRWLRLTVMAALTVAAVTYGVLPSLVAARADIDLVHTASMVFLGAAVLLQVASWVTYTALTRAVLPPTASVGWPTQLAIDLTGFGASHVLPGGGATAMGLRYRMMTRTGVPPATVVTTTATQTVLSDVALAACYLLGAVASVPSVMEHRSLQVTAAIGLAVVAGVVGGGAFLVRGHSSLTDRLHEAESRFGEWLRPASPGSVTSSSRSCETALGPGPRAASPSRTGCSTRRASTSASRPTRVSTSGRPWCSRPTASRTSSGSCP